VRKSIEVHDQVHSLTEAVRSFELTFAELFMLQSQRQQQVPVPVPVPAAVRATPSSTSAGASGPTSSNSHTTVITSSSAGMRVVQDGKTTVIAAAAATPSAFSAGAAGAAATSSSLLPQLSTRLSDSLHGLVATEAKCLAFLSNRIIASKKKSAELRKELLAYTALSMKVHLCCVFCLLKFFFSLSL
jgi:hypothetical protein